MAKVGSAEIPTKAWLQEGDLEIQQSPRPDSPTYFLLMWLQIEKVINQKLLRIIKFIDDWPRKIVR